MISRRQLAKIFTGLTSKTYYLIPGQVLGSEVPKKAIALSQRGRLTTEWYLHAGADFVCSQEDFPSILL